MSTPKERSEQRALAATVFGDVLGLAYVPPDARTPTPTPAVAPPALETRAAPPALEMPAVEAPRLPVLTMQERVERAMAAAMGAAYVPPPPNEQATAGDVAQPAPRRPDALIQRAIGVVAGGFGAPGLAEEARWNPDQPRGVDGKWTPGDGGGTGLGETHDKALQAVAGEPGGRAHESKVLMSAASYPSGAENVLGDLKANGFLDARPGGAVKVTAKGRRAIESLRPAHPAAPEVLAGHRALNASGSASYDPSKPPRYTISTYGGGHWMEHGATRDPATGAWKMARGIHGRDGAGPSEARIARHVEEAHQAAAERELHEIKVKHGDAPREDEGRRDRSMAEIARSFFAPLSGHGAIPDVVQRVFDNAAVGSNVSGMGDETRGGDQARDDHGRFAADVGAAADRASLVAKSDRGHASAGALHALAAKAYRVAGDAKAAAAHDAKAEAHFKTAGIDPKAEKDDPTGEKRFPKGTVVEVTGNGHLGGMKGAKAIVTGHYGSNTSGRKMVGLSFPDERGRTTLAAGEYPYGLRKAGAPKDGIGRDRLAAGDKAVVHNIDHPASGLVGTVEGAEPDGRVRLKMNAGRQVAGAPGRDIAIGDVVKVHPDLLVPKDSMDMRPLEFLKASEEQAMGAGSKAHKAFKAAYETARERSGVRDSAIHANVVAGLPHPKPPGTEKRAYVPSFGSASEAASWVKARSDSGEWDPGDEDDVLTQFPGDSRLAEAVDEANDEAE